jgi:TolB protein
LRVRTNEPARVYVVGSDGLSYTPSGRLARITWSSGEYFYHSRGEVDDMRLPEGPALVSAVRGFEWEPKQQMAEVREGGQAQVNLALERRENLPQQGWYSGDVHIHANYNNHEFITPEDVRDQVQAEDLHVANLMVANSTGPHIHDEQYFEGRPHRLSTPSHILYWVEEMRNAGLYGHLCLIGLKSLVKPLHTGFTNSAWPYDYPANHAQGEAAHRQGGAATYAHPGYNFTQDPQTMSARELPVDLALGSIDAMDVLSNAEEDAATAMWYRLLNTGLRCAISAGTDSFTNRRQHWLPGGERVYVNVPGPWNYERWVEGLKAGRSFATNGPIVRLTVAGKGPGEEIRLAAPGTVQVTATVTSFVPFETVELIANGKVAATARAGADGRSARLQTAYRLERSAWLAVRVRGPYHRLLPNDRFVYAHTSPVYCLVGTQKIGAREDAQFFVNWIDRLIAMAEAKGQYASEEQKREVISLFRKAQDYYRGVAR